MTGTLHLHVGPVDHSDLEDRLAAVDAGEEIEPEEPHVSAESLAALGRLLRPTNLELLEAIIEHEPDSIRALARQLDRSPSEVAKNVKELDHSGLLRIEREGRAKRPVVWYDEIEVDIPLGRDRDEGATQRVDAA